MGKKKDENDDQVVGGESIDSPTAIGKSMSKTGLVLNIGLSGLN